MVETVTNGQTTKLQDAAQNAVLQLMARWGILLICTVALPVGAWMGNRLIAALDKVVEKTDGLSIDMAGVKSDVGHLKEDVSFLKEKAKP